MYGAKSKAFTLIEVIFVFTIIAILLAILLPGMSTLKRTAQKLRDVSHLRKIAEAWKECYVVRGWPLAINNNEITPFMRRLAGVGRTSVSDMVLNDPHVYISPGDKYGMKLTKDGTLCKMNKSSGVIEGGTFGFEYKNAKSFMSNGDIIISYCFAINLPANVPPETTPFGFTRGLNKNGLWDEKAGLYGSKGGYVVYADGHVVWFDGSRPAKFLKYDKSGYSVDIRKAVPTGTIITCCNVGGANVLAPYKGENALAILYATGTGGS
jgi:hypothetical protein